jgi:hypothetical protein
MFFRVKGISLLGACMYKLNLTMLGRGSERETDRILTGFSSIISALPRSTRIMARLARHTLSGS